MINAGVDLYTVGTVLGHKDARSTKRYSHLNAATLQRAVNAIGGQKSPHNGAHLGTKKGPPKAAQVIDLLRFFGGARRSRTALTGFAIRGITALLSRHALRVQVSTPFKTVSAAQAGHHR